MTEKIRGPFGRLYDGRNTCDTPDESDTCCGTTQAALPDILYVRIQTPQPGLVPDIDVYTELYKYTEPRVCETPSGYDKCSCDPPPLSNTLRYISKLIHYSAYSCDPVTVCCLAVIWEAQRDPETGECAWTMYVHNPSDPYSVSYLDTGAACDGASGSHGFTVDSSGSQCILGGITGLSDIGVTISDTTPGGTEAIPCCKLCCAFDRTLYLTLDVPDCPDLDGQVIELTYYEAQSLEFPAFGSTVNPNGEHNEIWRGLSNICSCGQRVYFEVILNTFSNTDADYAQCRWKLSVNQDDCYSETQTEDDSSFCPTVVFSGTLDATDTCASCCPSGMWDFTATLNS